MNIDGRTEHDVPCPNKDDIKIPSPFDVMGSECEWSKFRCRLGVEGAIIDLLVHPYQLSRVNRQRTTRGCL